MGQFSVKNPCCPAQFSGEINKVAYFAQAELDRRFKP
jgi:hypothetical protein